MKNQMTEMLLDNVDNVDLLQNIQNKANLLLEELKSGPAPKTLEEMKLRMPKIKEFLDLGIEMDKLKTSNGSRPSNQKKSNYNKMSSAQMKLEIRKRRKNNGKG
jgi:hypothetical protein